jgi:basic amino acid/polyamine antiporter, APA family
MKNSLNNNGLKREIGLFSATILVIANMVGTGIFTTSGFIIQELGDPNAMLMCWIVGGIFALSGALCYGELGAMFPRAGGEYVFLKESFGEGVAFLSGWISLIVGFSAPIAAAAIAFATYLFRMLPVTPHAEFVFNLFGAKLFTFSPITVTAVAIIVIISMAHYHSLSLGTKVQNILTLFKVGFVVCFVSAGFIWGHGDAGRLLSTPALETVFTGEFAVALIFVSFAYSGWNAAAYLGGEIKDPEKNIRIALIAGTFLVMCIYLVLNLLYLYTLPSARMSGVLEVGAESATALFGKDIGKYFTGAIAVGLLSVLSAMIMTGPRVYYAMAKDGIFFKPFGTVNRLHRTPAYSIFLQGGVAVLLLLTASFDNLLLYIGFTLSLCATLTVIGMMKLRITKPELHRAYKTFGYPLTPLLFIAGNLWIICFSITSRPVTTLYGLATIGFGFLVYLSFRVRRNAKPIIILNADDLG